MVFRLVSEKNKQLLLTAPRPAAADEVRCRVESGLADAQRTGGGPDTMSHLHSISPARPFLTGRSRYCRRRGCALDVWLCLALARPSERRRSQGTRLARVM